MQKPAEIVTDVLELPESERTWIVSKILGSFDKQPGLSPAWRKEIADRIARHKSGEAQSVSSEEVHRDIQKILSS
ncbi:MAG: putative addiction module component (TIGR02574 family) [Akkermansiaceae bacterium]|jgi:putative addiction module component (TIGR02574 family)